MNTGQMYSTIEVQAVKEPQFQPKNVKGSWATENGHPEEVNQRFRLKGNCDPGI